MTSASEARLPAYVSLSRTTTRTSRARSASRTKFEPMKPAPPVTIHVCMREFTRAPRRHGLGFRLVQADDAREPRDVEQRPDPGMQPADVQRRPAR